MSRHLLAIATLALVASGCGGVEQEPNLAEAAKHTTAAGSSRVEIRASRAEAGEETALACDGAVDYQRKRLQLSCNDAFGETIVIGTAVYVRSEAIRVHTGKPWASTKLEESDSVFELSPHKLLEMLRAASLETERVGEEDVRGTSTVRYRLTVDCVQGELDCEGTAPVEVWIDGDGLVRRIWADQELGAGTIEFFDFGVEVDIEPPPADEVMDFDDGWTGYAPSPQGGDAAACSEADAKPISEAKALETLRRHGVSMTRDRSAYCIEGVAAVLENASKDFSDEGYVSCFLYEKPAPDAPATVVRRGVDGGDAELRLANLTCMILADSPTGEERIDRLEAAFDELQRAIRP